MGGLQGYVDGAKPISGESGYGVTSFAIWDLKSISGFWSWALSFGYVMIAEKRRCEL